MTTSVADLIAADVLTMSDGYRTKRSEHANEGYRILRVADVLNDDVRLDGPDFVSSEFTKAIGVKAAQAGDVLLTTKGTVGRVAVMPATDQAVVYSPQLCFFRVRDTSRLDPRWLSYWFRSGDFMRQASHRKDNTDMAAYINLADIRSLSLVLPAIHEQRGIAEVLGALDDKIATNTRIIEGAEALSAAQWSQATADGSSVPLSDLAEFVNGRAFTKGASGTGRVVIRIAELNSGLGGSTVRNDIEVGDRYLARPGDLLFAWSGSLTVHRWFRPEGIVNQHIFKVIPEQDNPMWLVHRALLQKLAEFKAIAADKATTMGHIQRRHLDEPVRIPSAEDVARLDGLMTGLWDRALAAEVENEQLIETRDALLPLLMSGRVTVKAGESVVGEVL